MLVWRSNLNRSGQLKVNITVHVNQPFQIERFASQPKHAQIVVCNQHGLACAVNQPAQAVTPIVCVARTCVAHLPGTDNPIGEHIVFDVLRAVRLHPNDDAALSD